MRTIRNAAVTDDTDTLLKLMKSNVNVIDVDLTGVSNCQCSKCSVRGSVSLLLINSYQL